MQAWRPAPGKRNNARMTAATGYHQSTGISYKSGRYPIQKIEPKQPWIIISSLAQHDLNVITEEQLMLRGATPKTSSPKKQKSKKKKTKIEGINKKFHSYFLLKDWVVAKKLR